MLPPRRRGRGVAAHKSAVPTRRRALGLATGRGQGRPLKASVAPQSRPGSARAHTRSLFTVTVTRAKSQTVTVVNGGRVPGRARRWLYISCLCNSPSPTCFALASTNFLSFVWIWGSMTLQFSSGDASCSTPTRRRRPHSRSGSHSSGNDSAPLGSNVESEQRARNPQIS